MNSDRVSTSGGHYHHGSAVMEPQPLGLPLPFSSKQSPNIFSVTSSNPIPPSQPVVLAPQAPPLPPVETREHESEEDVSDWEHEVDPDTGSLFYVDTFSQHGQESKQKSTGLKNSCSPGARAAAAAAPVKLSRLVRRRESKRDRPTTSKQAAAVARNGGLAAVNEKVNSGGVDNSSDNDSSTYGQIKTFEAFVEEGGGVIGDDAPDRSITELHEINVKFNAKQLKPQLPHFRMALGGGANDNPTYYGILLDSVLGIVAQKRGDPDGPELGVIVVDGYQPRGPSLKVSNELLIGDIIRSMDGQHVTLESVNAFLVNKVATATSTWATIKLTIQRPIKEECRVPFPSSNPPFIDEETDEPSVRDDVPHLLLYLTKEGVTEASPEMADVVYRFPNNETTAASKGLFKARGVFVTLCQLLADISVNKPIVSSLLMDDGDLVHVGYVEEGQDVMLLALPASCCTASDAVVVIKNLARVLRLLWGNLARAMHCPEIFRVVQQLLSDVLRAQGGSQGFECLMPAAKWLKLPPDVQFQVEDAVNQLESADFRSYSEEFYDLPREFVILGSCLFHRGMVVASHLPRDDMVDVALWVKFQKHLRLSHKLPFRRVVAWNQVYLTRDPKARTFLLVVGLGYQLLAVILECGGAGESLEEPVRPDPFYVDQAGSTLEHLADMGIPLVCERWMTLPPNPDLVDIDRLYQNISKGKRLDASSLGLASLSGTGGIVLRRTKSVERLSFDQKSVTSSETSSADIQPSNDMPKRRPSSASENSEEMQTAFMGDDEKNREYMQESDAGPVPPIRQRTRHNFSNLSNKSGSSRTTSSLTSSARFAAVSGAGAFGGGVPISGTRDDGDDEELVTYRISQLTTGPENVLLHHLHLDIGEGVYLSPVINPDRKDRPVLDEFVDNFRASAQIIHSTFQMSLGHRDNFKSSFNSANNSQPKPWTNKTLVSVKEQAMLFHWTPNVKKSSGSMSKASTLSYWVCGRMVQSPGALREFYVAYHESASQNMVELAFKMAFGIHL